MKNIKLLLAITIVMSSMTNCGTPDNVKTQGIVNVYRKSLNTTGKGIGEVADKTAKAIGVNKGEVGYPCKKNKSCNSRNCASGLCQKKFEAGGPCQKGVQCKSGKCKSGSCKA